MEGVNLNTNNVMSLHTNETCILTGNASVMTGTLENTNCAYYPDYNVGCGVQDPRSTSYGIGFNQAGGGVYAMQWTSESILIWNWARSAVPADIDNKTPDPGSWGLPVAQLAVGNCSVDQHFQSHKIIFDNTFCGSYAGVLSIWNTNDDLSCAGSTGLATCDNYVANVPEAFAEAYWAVNNVRVYQLVDPDDSTPFSTYIASEQAPSTATSVAPAPVATPNLNVDELCPQYNFSIITDGKYQYEIACDFDPPGPDRTGQPYQGFSATSMADCIAGCTYMNEHNGTNSCGGVSHYAAINFCYFKKYIDAQPTYRPGYNEIRLIYYGYPQITDDPNLATADSTLTTSFIETIPTPQTYRPLTTTTTPSITSTSASQTTSYASATLPPAMGDNSTTTSTSSLPSDYSETVTQTLSNSTSTTASVPSSVTSTDPEVTNADFYIVFNVDASAKRLAKRDVQFLAFDDNGNSELVTSEDEATKFHLADDGTLMAGDQYVSVNTDAGALQLSDTAPAEPLKVEVSDDGSVSLPGAPDLCLTGSGALAVASDGDSCPAGSTSVQPELLAASDDTSTTTASSSVTSTGSTASSGVSSSTPTSTSSGITSSGSSSTGSGPITITMTSVSTSISGSSSQTSSSNHSSTAQIINDFVYAGCFGIPSDASAASLPGISVPLVSDSMTNEKCTAACKNVTDAYYAATHEQNCLCSTSVDLFTLLLDYPDSSCNVPCPGANREMCGGNVQFEGAVPTTSASMRKRQANLVLVSLYNNTILLPLAGEDDGPNPPGSSTTSQSSTTARSTTITTTTTTSNGGIIGGGSLTTTSSSTTFTGFDPNDVIYNVTGTNTFTVISTTYVEDCPTGLTTRSTTIIVPHCGCTASYNEDLGISVPVASPTVPMVTVTKSCAACASAANTAGASANMPMITLTVPNTSSISQLAAQVTQNAVQASGASASAAASAYASAAAAAQAGNVPAPAQPANLAAASNVAQPANGAPAGQVSALVQSVGAMTTPGVGPITPQGMTPEADVGAVSAVGPQAASALPGNVTSNGTVTTPKIPSGSNGTAQGIASFRSSASRLLKVGVPAEMIWWTDSRFVLSIVIGMFAGVFAGLW